MTIRGRIVRTLAPATYATVHNVCTTGGPGRRETLDTARRELGLPPAKHPARSGA